MTRAHITLVVDRSGSMRAIKEEAEGGIRKFLEDQAALTDVKVKVSLYQFDAEYEHVYGPVKVAKVPPYQLEPRGMTALYDAVGKGVADTKATVAAAVDGKKPDKVVVVIMTDGAENSSREYTSVTVKQLVEEQKAAGWEFVFLAGDLSAAEFGRASGLRTTGYNPAVPGQTQTAYAAASAGTSSYLRGDAKSVDMPDAVPDGTPPA
jgi:uncharacterized protein YegL